MENRLSQNITQKQTLQISAGQLQGLNLLAAPALELENLLAAELQNNPLLEVISSGREVLAGDLLGAAAEAGNELAPGEFDGDNESRPLEEYAGAEWEDFSGDEQDRVDGTDAAEAQRKRDYMFDSLAARRTLEDLLLEQLNFAGVSPKLNRLARAVIGNLDEQGFLTIHPADMAMSMDAPMEDIAEAVALIQSFDPPGVGARDVRESLVLQLQRSNYPDERIYTLLEQYSEELSRNQLPLIARSMKIPVELVQKFMSDLRKLNSVPVRGLDLAEVEQTVIPEMVVRIVDGEICIYGHEGAFPRLGLVRRYQKMLEDPATDEDSRKYLREKLAAAENLIKSLDLREDTLRRLTGVIVKHQADFFRNGMEHLQPMTMSEAAGELDLHETTISRAVAGKYIDTPQGVLEYKFFFSGGYTAADGEDISSRAVKEKIRSMISAEDPRKPLSDEAISKMLADEGLKVARRTVAKYRESMNILPTNLRRRH